MLLCVTHSLRFTSGVAPANLWPAWQLSHSLPHTCKQALVGLKTRTYRATAHSVRPVRQTLYRLSYAGSASEDCNFIFDTDCYYFFLSMQRTYMMTK